MNWFFSLVSGLILLLAAFAALAVIVVGLTYINSQWNCIQWAKQTGDKTQVIAAECYVYDGKRWELFETYIKGHRLQLETPAK